MGPDEKMHRYEIYTGDSRLYLRLPAFASKVVCSIILEVRIFERMTAVASTTVRISSSGT